MNIPERTIEASTLSEVSLCKNNGAINVNSDILMHDYNIYEDKKTMHTFLVTEKVCISMSPVGRTAAPSD